MQGGQPLQGSSATGSDLEARMLPLESSKAGLATREYALDMPSSTSAVAEPACVPAGAGLTNLEP